MINVVFFFSFLILLYAVSVQFYSISYLQLKSPKEDKMAVLQCSLCCPLVFCAIFALLPFFLFLRCQRPCATPLTVVYTILDISETSFFVTPIGFLSTRNRWIRLPRLHLKLLSRPERGGGGTPYDSLYGEAPPERGLFFRLQVYEGVGNSLVEVYKRVGKSVIWVCKRAQGLTDEFYGFTKSRKRSIFEIDSYLKRHRAIQKNGNLSSPRWVLSPNSKNIN